MTLKAKRFTRAFPACFRIIFLVFSILLIAGNVFCQDIEYRLSQDLSFRNYPTDIRFGSRIQQGLDQTWFYTDINVPTYRYREADLVGENEILFFFNPKVCVSDWPTNEESLGVGFRYYHPRGPIPDGYLTGVNIFYDTALSREDIRFDRIGMGLEFLTQWFDARANYYLPTTEKKLDEQSYGFAQTALVRHDDYEEAVEGFDLEGGLMIPYVSEIVETRIYGGMYYFDSDLGVEVEGTKARVEVRPNRSLILSGEMRDDDYFEDEFYVSVAFSFELGSPIQSSDTFSIERLKNRWRFGPGYRNLVERMTEPIVREQDMITIAKRKTTNIEEVVYVDNSNDGDSSEDGSLDHPHNTLAEAFTNARYKDGIWIYVDQGDGTATGYTGNYTLGANVTLWGEGCEYLGLAGGSYPILNGGGAGNVVTMDQNSTVMGFDITNGANSGVYAANATGVRIKYNTIHAGGTSGINLLATGTNRLTATITGNTIHANTNDGILLEADNTSVMTATLIDNKIRDHVSSGISIDADNSSSLSMSASRNVIIRNTVTGVLLDGSTSATMILDMGGGTMGAAGGNSVYNNGLQIDADGGDDGTVDGTVTATGNWWGTAPPDANEFDQVDSSSYANYLSSDPND